MNTIEKIAKLEQINTEAKRLTREIMQEQSACQHNFGGTVAAQSGVNTEKRWKCQKCGKTQFAHKRKVTQTEPDFSE